MKDFLAWNDAVAQHFFRPEHAGKTVYMYVTPELIDEIGGNEGVPELINALREGPPWDTRRGICQNALRAMQGWRGRDLKFPPYIGYLALFVLAAGLEGEWAPHAYYPRLRALLGDPEGPNYPSFDRMWELWTDLEEWLKERGGELGIVRTDLAGDLASAMVHVNYPVSQAILTEAERASLHEIFAAADFDPGDPPPDQQLAQAIRAAGGGRLRARTLRALDARQRDSDYTAVLMDRILEELDSWDGEGGSAGTQDAAHRHGTAMLCLQRDSSAKRVKLELRCHFADPFPPRVNVTYGQAEYRCRELAHGISTALCDTAGNKFNPAVLEWTKPSVLASPNGDVLLRLFAADVRVFVDASARGLPGYVGVRALDPARAFLLAASPAVADTVRQWGATACSGFEELAFTGLPAGWSLFSAAGASNDELVHERIPQLSFSRKLRRIKIDGGLRVPGTQFYFRFAPPAIRLEGASQDAEVRFNDVSTQRDADGVYSIPEDLLARDTIAVSCTDAGRELQRTIYLRDAADVSEQEPREYSPLGDTQLRPEGAAPHGVPAGALAIPLPPWVRPVAATTRATLIGQVPGQIALASVAPPWPPVWRILHHSRNATVEYVAPDLLEPAMQPCADRRALRHWKEILWHHRKRIEPPPFEPLRRLWSQYQHAARNA